MAWTLLSNARFGYNYSAVTDEKAPLIALNQNVSIIISSFNEKPEVEKACLDSIVNQNIVKAHTSKFEIIITRLKGKLNARDYAIRRATGSIILNCDSDTVYFPNWANLMLEPFQDERVIATNGPTFFKNLATDLYFSFIVDTHIHFLLSGRNSAFRKKTYLEIGGFDLSINQKINTQIWDEEEILFRKRLNQAGKVKDVMAAPCIHQVGLESGRSWTMDDNWFKLVTRPYWKDMFGMQIPRLNLVS